MRTRSTISLKTLIPAAAISFLAFITLASAGQDVVVKVPFDFQAGSTHFGPGAYVLSVDKTPSGALIIRSADSDQDKGAIVMARKSTTPGYGTAPTVSFRIFGDTRFLTAIQSEGSGRWDIVPTSEEIARTRVTGNATVATLSAMDPSK